MTVKEQLVEILRGEGYDFITACEHAQVAINEFLASGEQRRVIHSKTKSITLERKNAPKV